MPLGLLRFPPAMTEVIGPPQAARASRWSASPKPVEGEFETYRFSNIKFAQASSEGHVTVNFDAKPVTEKIAIARRNLVGVPLKQASAPRLIFFDARTAGAGFPLARWGGLM